MHPTNEEVIRLLRETSERLWFDFPEQFRRADRHINVPALKRFLLEMHRLPYYDMSCDAEAIADRFITLPGPHKAEILEQTFSIYWAAHN